MLLFSYSKTPIEYQENDMLLILILNNGFL